MKENSTPLTTKVEQLLTEARVIIPGGQALFGFQFIAMLTTGFDKLPATSQLMHTTALCFTALNVIVLMAPAALHRLSFGGEDLEAFLQLGSALLISAPMLLALAVAGRTLRRIRQGSCKFLSGFDRRPRRLASDDDILVRYSPGTESHCTPTRSATNSGKPSLVK